MKVFMCLILVVIYNITSNKAAPLNGFDFNIGQNPNGSPYANAQIGKTFPFENSNTQGNVFAGANTNGYSNIGGGLSYDSGPSSRDNLNLRVDHFKGHTLGSVGYGINWDKKGELNAGINTDGRVSLAGTHMMNQNGKNPQTLSFGVDRFKNSDTFGNIQYGLSANNGNDLLNTKLSIDGRLDATAAHKWNGDNGSENILKLGANNIGSKDQSVGLQYGKTFQTQKGEAYIRGGINSNGEVAAGLGHTSNDKKLTFEVGTSKQPGKAGNISGNIIYKF